DLSVVELDRKTEGERLAHTTLALLHRSRHSLRESHANALLGHRASRGRATRTVRNARSWSRSDRLAPHSVMPAIAWSISTSCSARRRDHVDHVVAGRVSATA